MTRLTLILAALSTAAVLSCSDDPALAPEEFGTVVVNLDHNVAGAALERSMLLYTNSRGTQYSVSDLQYLISDVVLQRSDGEVYGSDGPQFRDAFVANTRSFTIPNVPNGTYTMISFTFGLDALKNTHDRYDNEPWAGLMEWHGPLGGDMGLGYHYMMMEGNFEDTPGGATMAYTTHTGARWCNGFCGSAGDSVVDYTPQHHYFRVLLPLSMIVNHDTRTVSINMDINGWYTDHSPGDLYDTEYDWHDLATQAIMAETEIQNKLQENGGRCFTATVAGN